MCSALAEWLSASEERKLVVMFHEMWATGKPWQSAFWQVSAQKACVERLFDLASCAIVSNATNEKHLREFAREGRIVQIPLGSTYSYSGSGAKNWRSAVVFGRWWSRETAIKMHAQLIKRLDRARLIEQFVLAGESCSPANDPGLNLLKKWKLNAPVHCEFDLAIDSLPQAFLDSGLALMSARTSALMKSTAFHISASLGQVAIARQNKPADSPLLSGRHFLSYSDPQTIIDTIGQTEQLLLVSKEAAKLARDEFSWRMIAAKWSELLSTL